MMIMILLKYWESEIMRERCLDCKFVLDCNKIVESYCDYEVEYLYLLDEMLDEE